MSQETLQWLNDNVVRGFTEKYPKAWWTMPGFNNHYPDSVPSDVVRSLLLRSTPTEGRITVTFFDAAKGEYVTVADPERKCILVNGKPVNYPDNGFKIHSFEQWLFDYLGFALDTSTPDLGVASAGLLKKGAVAWVQVELLETQEKAGMKFRPFITAASSLNGSLATQYFRGAQLVVCDNTLSMAQRDAENSGSIIKIKHTVNSLDNGRIADVREALDIMVGTVDTISQELDRLAGLTIGEDELMAFLDTYKEGEFNTLTDKGELKEKRAFTTAETGRNAMLALWHHDDRVMPWQGTGLGVFQMASTYYQHKSIVRGADGGRVERMAENNITGKTAQADAGILATLDRIVKDRVVVPVTAPAPKAKAKVKATA
jgi:phage/plasmid-like protein (TIGR03299 family)